MKYQELVEKVAEEAGASKRQVDYVIKSLGDVIHINMVAEGDEISIPNLGKFKTKVSAARTSRNPRTGEAVQVPAKLSVKFSPSLAFKKSLNGQ